MSRTIGVSIYLDRDEETFVKLQASREALSMATWLRLRLRDGILAQRKLSDGREARADTKAAVRKLNLFV